VITVKNICVWEGNLLWKLIHNDFSGNSTQLAFCFRKVALKYWWEVWGETPPVTQFLSHDQTNRRRDFYAELTSIRRANPESIFKLP
jgi:hypothetical protein